MSEKIVKDITSGPLAKEKILNGVNIPADVVGSSMGYRGLNVIIETDYGMPNVTKDGYDILQSIFLQDPVESMACEIIKEASKKTVDLAGDGTSATIILAQAFIQNSFKAVESGESPIDVKLRIEKSVEKVVDYLKELSVPVTDSLLYDIAKTSANGDEKIAKLVQEAYISAGDDGSVTHTRSNTDETFVDNIEGTLVENGFVDEGFVNVPSSQSVIFDDEPLVLCSLIKFQTPKQILPFLEFAVSTNRDLVIISDMEHGIRNMILTNKIMKNSNFVVVQPPSHGKKQKDILSDLALVCGTEIISSLSGSDFTGRETMFLGTCGKANITKSNTIITPSLTIDREFVDGKIADLKSELLEATSELEKNYIKERISKLTGGISIIKVGGITPSEVEEKIARVDDAVCAVRSAKEEGVVAGGGGALYHIACMLAGDIDNVTSVSLFAPFDKIISNAGLKNITFGDYPVGYDVKEFKEVNMFDAGIVDATKVVRNALINAASASNNLLMTNNVVTLKRIDNE